MNETEFEIFKSLENYFQVNKQETSFEKIIKGIKYSGIELFKRNCYPYHFTASAWIVDKERNHTLLIFHKNLQMWIQPGGHADGETNLSKVALKEAQEETGLKSACLTNERVFDFDITPIPAFKNIPAHSHLDARFVIEADIKEPITESEEILGAKWFPINNISDKINDEGVLRMAQKTLLLNTIKA